jgi:GntR family transcriptional regulator / MocR family aminotransferase
VDAAVRAGVLRAGERLPSTRALAARLRLSRNTVIAAYDEPTARGLTEPRRGAGVRVAAGTAGTAAAARAVPLQDTDGNPLLLFF